MVFYRGKFIKDLKYLNRKIQKVIVVDGNKDRVAKNKQNLIIIDDFDGNEGDEELFKLMVLLEGTHLLKRRVRKTKCRGCENSTLKIG